MNWLSFLFYCGATLATYSFLAIPILMELSLKDPKRNAEGLLRINHEGWVIKNLYRANGIGKRETWPRNICQLYRGLWWGTLIYALLSSIIAFLALIVSVIGFLGGYIITFSSPTEPFHPYERWGKHNEKVWIAPWKILIPASWLAMAIFWPKTTASVVYGLIDLINATGTGTIAAIGYIRYYGYFVAVITLLFLLYCAKCLITESESWAALKDLLASIKDFLCIRTTID